MLRRLNALLLFILLLIALLAPYLIWQSRHNQPLRVLIVDKTVPDEHYREHRGLIWLLNYYKLYEVRPLEAAFDYVGYRPGGLLNPIADGRRYQLIYLADTAGVYEADGKLRYGGMEMLEWEALRGRLEPSATLIAEFNSFAPPTGRAVRFQMSEFLGLSWSGWLGCYYQNLAKVPLNLQNNYRKYEDKIWDFKGAGMVLNHEDGQILVLELGKDLRAKGLETRFSSANQERYGFKNTIIYSGCFDIVAAGTGTTTEAFYQFSLSERAEAVLSGLGIPKRFPAVIRYQGQGYQSYYFAGNYAYSPRFLPSYQLSGISSLYQVLPWASDQVDSFFWKFYLPLMRKILSEM
ncbi:MAG: hypothetical protein R2880_02000 [Deinococcales bacterium]